MNQMDFPTLGLIRDNLKQNIKIYLLIMGWFLPIYKLMKLVLKIFNYYLDLNLIINII
jgi:hypothetical protein